VAQAVAARSQRIETVISQLEQRFSLAKTQARDAWH